MNVLRKRAQRQFPMVPLTMLSIVQALALELLWEYVRGEDGLTEISWLSFLAWMQVVATLFGIVLIWVTYASNAMRFRWTPSTSDSVYPFIIGLLEFCHIELLGTQHIGLWTMMMAIIFAAMVLVSHFIMRRARRSGKNGAFFDASSPAQLHDFYPQIAVVVALTLGGAYAWLSSATGGFALALILAIIALLVWQYLSVARFWETSIQAD